MPEPTIKSLAAAIQRSGLIGKEALAAAYDDWKRSEPAAADPRHSFAQFLTARGQLSPWQVENLLAGKSQGFFIGRYKLLGHLGTGGMSSVYLAEHSLIRRQVAIKILPSSKAHDTMLADRFSREVRATARLNHPNIVRAFDMGIHDALPYLVMEYVAGSDLKALVKKKGPLPLAMAANFVAQVACGLQHAHTHGLIHRDIKPANLVVNEHGIVKILDLGLARLDDAETAALTQAMPEKIMGTVDYLAPEQASDCHAVDHRADIYSLGCTFYFLLTGHPVFTEGTLAQRIARHQSQRPRDVRADRADCPHALAEICMRMLAKNPDDRYRSAAEIAVRIYRWLVRNDYGSLLAQNPGFAQLSAWETADANSPVIRPSSPPVPGDSDDARRAESGVAAAAEAPPPTTGNGTKPGGAVSSKRQGADQVGSRQPSRDAAAAAPPPRNRGSRAAPIITFSEAKGEASLAHRARSSRAMRTPWWLWTLLAVASTACIILLILLILKNGQ
jgi:serine/threonine-protein kinase